MRFVPEPDCVRSTHQYAFRRYAPQSHQTRTDLARKLAVLARCPIDQEPDDVLDEVGPRLRALRRHRGITLANLATRPASPRAPCPGLKAGSAARTWSCCCRWPAPTTFHWTTSSAPRAFTSPDPVVRDDLRAADPAAWWSAGVQNDHPAQPEPLEPTPQTHDGFEWLYVLNGHLRLVLGDPVQLAAIALRVNAPNTLNTLHIQPSAIPAATALRAYPFTDDFTLGCGGHELGGQLPLDATTPLPAPSTPGTDHGAIDTPLAAATILSGWASISGTTPDCVLVTDGTGTIVGGGITGLDHPSAAATGWHAVAPPGTNDLHIIVTAHGQTYHLPPTTK
jgi:hypothetical protein